jgi:hypothetical protein
VGSSISLTKKTGRGRGFNAMKRLFVPRDLKVIHSDDCLCGCVMYKFKIGERLFPARSVGLNVSDGAYVIVKRLPMRDGEFEYQIRSLTESDERVVRESQLRSYPGGNRLG